MAVLSRFRAAFRARPSEDTANSSSVAVGTDEKKESAVDDTTVVNGSEESQPEHPSEDLQRGVQQVEAVTLAWSRASLIAVFLK